MKALVIEDSRLARDGLLRLLSRYSELEIIGAAKDADEARLLIAKHLPDLLFLDVHMPGESGFDLLESLSYQPKIIFTTAYPEHAIRSFDHRTVDYLLKPISEERLGTAVARLLDDGIIQQAAEPLLEIDSRIFVKDGETCHLIRLRNVQYIESHKNYIRLFFDGKSAFIKKSLTQVEQRLPGSWFFRASRNFIVNFHAIVSIVEAVGDGYEVTMGDGSVIQISRRNAARLKELLSL